MCIYIYIEFCQGLLGFSLYTNILGLYRGCIWHNVERLPGVATHVLNLLSIRKRIGGREKNMEATRG